MLLTLAAENLRRQNSKQKRQFIAAFVFFFYIFTRQFFRFVSRRQGKELNSSLTYESLFKSKILPIERELGIAPSLPNLNSIHVLVYGCLESALETMFPPHVKLIHDPKSIEDAQMVLVLVDASNPQDLKLSKDADGVNQATELGIPVRVMITRADAIPSSGEMFSIYGQILRRFSRVDPTHVRFMSLNASNNSEWEGNAQALIHEISLLDQAHVMQSRLRKIKKILSETTNQHLVSHVDEQLSTQVFPALEMLKRQTSKL